MEHRLNESTLSHSGKEYWLSVGYLKNAPLGEHSLLGICRHPSALQRITAASGATMHLSFATAHKGKWGPLRDIPEVKIPKSPLRSNWRNIKIWARDSKGKHHQICKRALATSKTSDHCFYGVKKQQHILIVARKTQVKHFRKNLSNTADSGALRLVWQSSEAAVAINLKDQLDKCVSRIAWKCWVGLLSSLSAFSFD